MSYNILQSYRCLLKPTGGCSATAAVVNIATKEGRGEPLPRLGSLATLVFGICVPGMSNSLESYYRLSRREGGCVSPDSNPIVSGFVIPNPIYLHDRTWARRKRTHSKQEGREGGQKDSYDEPEPPIPINKAKYTFISLEYRSTGKDIFVREWRSKKSVLVGDFSLSLSVSESLCSGYSSYKEKGYEI